MATKRTNMKKQSKASTQVHANTTQVQSRDPVPQTRDPERATRKPRHYIPASMPTVCPKCGGTTRMADGRHVDPVRRRILEYRTCARCGELLAAGRAMTQNEVERLCSRSDAVAEYEETDR